MVYQGVVVDDQWGQSSVRRIQRCYRLPLFRFVSADHRQITLLVQGQLVMVRLVCRWQPVGGVCCLVTEGQVETVRRIQVGSGQGQLQGNARRAHALGSNGLIPVVVVRVSGRPLPSQHRLY